MRRENKPNGSVLLSKEGNEQKIDGAMAMINAVFVSVNGEDQVSSFEVVRHDDDAGAGGAVVAEAEDELDGWNWEHGF